MHRAACICAHVWARRHATASPAKPLEDCSAIRTAVNWCARLYGCVPCRRLNAELAYRVRRANCPQTAQTTSRQRRRAGRNPHAQHPQLRDMHRSYTHRSKALLAVVGSDGSERTALQRLHSAHHGARGPRAAARAVVPPGKFRASLTGRERRCMRSGTLRGVGRTTFAGV